MSNPVSFLDPSTQLLWASERKALAKKPDSSSSDKKTLSILLPESSLAKSGSIEPDFLTSKEQVILLQLFNNWGLDNKICLFELLFLDINQKILELSQVDEIKNKFTIISRELQNISMSWSQSFLIAYGGYCSHAKTPIDTTTERNIYLLSPQHFIKFLITPIQKKISDLNISIGNIPILKSTKKNRIALLQKKHFQDFICSTNKALDDINIRLTLFAKLLQNPQAEALLSKNNVGVIYKGNEKLNKEDPKIMIKDLSSYLKMLSQSLIPNDLTKRYLGIHENSARFFSPLSKKLAAISSQVNNKKPLDAQQVREFSLDLQSILLDTTEKYYQIKFNIEQIQKENIPHEKYCNLMKIEIISSKNQAEFLATLEGQINQLAILFQSLYDIQRIFDDAIHIYDDNYLTNESLYYQFLLLCINIPLENIIAQELITIQSYLPPAQKNNPKYSKIISFLHSKLKEIFNKYNNLFLQNEYFAEITAVKDLFLKFNDPLLFRLYDWLGIFNKMNDFWKSLQKPGPKNLFDLLSNDLEELAVTFRQKCIDESIEISDQLIENIKNNNLSHFIFISGTTLMHRIVHELLYQEKSLLKDYSDSDFIPERLQKALRFTSLNPDSSDSPDSEMLSSEEEGSANDEISIAGPEETISLSEPETQKKLHEIKGKEPITHIEPPEKTAKPISKKKHKTVMEREKTALQKQISNLHIKAIEKPPRLFGRSGKKLKRRRIIQALERIGFSRRPNSSTHERFSFRGQSVFVPLGHNGTVPVGTAIAIEKQALDITCSRHDLI